MMCGNAPSGGSGGGGSANVPKQEETPKINREYANFLENGKAQNISPASVKVGDDIITRYTNPDGEKVHEKWTFVNTITGKSDGKDYIWGSDIKVTDVKTTAKTVTIIGKTGTNSTVKRTFGKDDLMFKRKKK